MFNSSITCCWLKFWMTVSGYKRGGIFCHSKWAIPLSCGLDPCMHSCPCFSLFWTSSILCEHFFIGASKPLYVFSVCFIIFFSLLSPTPQIVCIIHWPFLLLFGYFLVLLMHYERLCARTFLEFWHQWRNKVCQDCLHSAIIYTYFGFL